MSLCTSVSSFHPFVIYLHQCITPTNRAHSRVKKSATMMYSSSSTNFLSYMSAEIIQNKWPTALVPSDMNLSAFLRHLQNYSVDKQLRLGKLRMMQHWPYGSPISFKTKDNQMVEIKLYECEDPSCDRCNTGTGGYRFQWIGPWTCSTATTASTPYLARTAWRQCEECPACTVNK